MEEEEADVTICVRVTSGELLAHHVSLPLPFILITSVHFFYLTRQALSVPPKGK